MHITLVLILLALALEDPLCGAIVSLLLTFTTGLFGIRVVLKKIGPKGSVATRLINFYSFIRWPI